MLATHVCSICSARGPEIVVPGHERAPLPDGWWALEATTSEVVLPPHLHELADTLNETPVTNAAMRSALAGQSAMLRAQAIPFSCILTVCPVCVAAPGIGSALLSLLRATSDRDPFGFGQPPDDNVRPFPRPVE